MANILSLAQASILFLLATASPSGLAGENAPCITETEKAETAEEITQLCESIGSKLSSVSTRECLALNLTSTGHYSSTGKAIGAREFSPIEDKVPLGKVLFIGGIHGDEYAAVSVTFKWMNILNKHHSGLFHWRVIPLMNPDGLLQKRSKRMNANGVDLNRNFPTTNWHTALVDYWERRTGKNKRRYPGPFALSEPESRWLFTEIAQFQPDVIVSVHAPHGIVDFDGPSDKAPEKLGDLNLKLLGTYPGSLGNFANVYGGMPVVTLELPHAGIMPSKQQISHIWTDLVRWLRHEVEWKALEETVLEEQEEPAEHISRESESN